MHKHFVPAFVAVLFCAACTMSDVTPVAPIESSLAPRLGRGGAALPTCAGASDCAAGPFICVGEDPTVLVTPAVMTTLAAGISGDSRGAYVQGSDGVRYSVVGTAAMLTLDPKKGLKNPRTYTVNLNSPVPGGGGAALGVITAGTDVNVETQWQQLGDARRSLHDIPVGQTVTANQIDVTFHINGRFHVLQMGPQAYGHCHGTPTQVNGIGTSTGTIFRASATKWVIDLPAGSVGRLFDLYNTTEYAVDKGLYYTQVHFEIGN